MKNIKSNVVTTVLSVLVGAFTVLGVFATSRPTHAETVSRTCADGSTVQGDTSATPDSIERACQSTGSDNEITDYGPPIDTGEKSGTHQCGKGEGSVVYLGFNIGCRGGDPTYPGERLNPIIDMLFAFFRFLSLGVGLVVIGSIIIAGIQYSTSRGNSQSTQAAIKRIVSSVGALFLYIFIYAIANFLIPGGMF